MSEIGPQSNRSRDPRDKSCIPSQVKKMILAGRSVTGGFISQLRLHTILEADSAPSDVQLVDEAIPTKERAVRPSWNWIFRSYESLLDPR